MNNRAVLIGLAVLAFLVALLLVIMIVRLLLGGRLRLPGSRRQARLGIVDAFDLDRQRQLIIVRRDNTEHLIMIGGPNDLLIESEIVRVEARETRRDKDYGGDARIPAPLPPVERAEPPPPPDPLLPSPLPERAPLPPVQPVAAATPAPPPAAVPIRSPTFPLPPRRPAPLPVEPVVAPPPPDVTAPPSPLPDLAASQAPIAEPSEAPVKTPSLRPPFLKPLPPRPPIRPLRRTTPQALSPGAVEPTMAASDTSIVPPAPAAPTPREPALPAPAPTVPTSPSPRPVAPEPPSPVEPPRSVEPPRPPAAAKPAEPATEMARPASEPLISLGRGAAPTRDRPLIVEPKPTPRAPEEKTAPPSPSVAEEPKDALESLEEEMAKLLGRGPG